MSLPERRRALPRLSLLSRPVIMSLVVLAGLIFSLYLLRKQQAALDATDTLQVSMQGLKLNGKKISLQAVEKKYSTGPAARRLHVVFDSNMPWGQTWGIRDTLMALAKNQENLTITGLDEIR
jgi:hypothetical protein